MKFNPSLYVLKYNIYMYIKNEKKEKPKHIIYEGFDQMKTSSSCFERRIHVFLYSI